MVATFLISVVVGFAIGILSGLLGVGGGVIMVPVFRLAFGMSPVSSTATSLFTIIPTSLSGAVTHIRGKTCLPRLGLALGLGGACTSWIGVMLAQRSPGWLVMVAAALVIGYSGFTMLQKAMKMPKGRKRTAPVADAPAPEPAVAPASAYATDSAPASMAASAAAPAAASAVPAPDFAGKDLAKAALIGVVAGVASGFVGLGGGFIMVPLMVSHLKLPMRLASGTSLIAVMILAIPATVLQCVLGNVSYLAGIAIACGSIPGAILGARLLSRVPERALRFVFAAFLGVAAILLVARELGVLG